MLCLDLLSLLLFEKSLVSRCCSAKLDESLILFLIKEHCFGKNKQKSTSLSLSVSLSWKRCGIMRGIVLLLRRYLFVAKFIWDPGKVIAFRISN